MHNEKKKSRRLPHQFLSNAIKKTGMPISRFDIYNHINRHIIPVATTSTEGIIHSPDDEEIVNSPVNESIASLSVTANVAKRNKGGRPKGTNKNNKRLVENAILAAKNEIVHLYQAERTKKQINERVQKGCLQRIINAVKTKRNIEDKQITLNCIKQRLKQNRNAYVTNLAPGPTSPLHDVETVGIQLIITMSRVGQSFTSGQGLELMNSLIKDTPHQEKLNEWRQEQGLEQDGQVGYSYWQGFLKRNSHMIKSTKGVKYELNRKRWTTYSNFLQMYELIGEEMIGAGVAQKIEPVWMNSKGDVVDEENAVGCKVDLDITHPDWIIFMDEVGSDTSQKMMAM